MLILSFTTSEIITVYVGRKRKQFYLHRGLTCDRSPFMEKCLSKNRFEEGEKNELYLPEDDPKAFAIVVEWIYRSRLLPMGSSAGGPEVLDLSSAYCMADKFGMEELQNVIMDYIRACLRVTNNPHVHAQGHSHNHMIGGSGGHSSGATRDAARLGLISSLSSSQGDRDANSMLTPESTRPNYAGLSLCHFSGPPKSPLKRFFTEHLVYHMMTYARWYHNDFTKNPPTSSRPAKKSPLPGGTLEDERLLRDRENFEKLFEDQELSLLIMRKIWQWQSERWGDPARDKGCAYHVHSSTQCEYKKAGAAAMAVGAKPGLTGRGSLSSSPGNPAALLQGLGGGGRHASWVGGPSAAAAGLIGSWQPGAGW